jgi:hypothetical protein
VTFFGLAISKAIGRVGLKIPTFLGPNGNRFVHWHFMVQKSLDFLGPLYGFARNKIMTFRLVNLSFVKNFTNDLNSEPFSLVGSQLTSETLYIFSYKKMRLQMKLNTSTMFEFKKRAKKKKIE